MSNLYSVVAKMVKESTELSNEEKENALKLWDKMCQQNDSVVLDTDLKCPNCGNQGFANCSCQPKMYPGKW